MLVLTIPMLVLGFYYLGRFRFLIRASYVTIIYSVGVDVILCQSVYEYELPKIDRSIKCPVWR